MLKRKIRCPHCGKRGLSRYGLSCSLRAPNVHYRNFSGLKCSKCNEWCDVRDYGKRTTDIVFWTLIILTLVLWLIFWKISIWICIGIGIVTIVLMNLLFVGSRYYVPLSITGYSDNDEVIVFPNCKVKLNDNKYIRKMWVYGLKFETETKNIKFKERFTDGLVPAQFYPSKNGDNEFEIRIIGREFVPDEVLFEGAEFLVEDIDGIFICKGKITKLDLEY